MNRHVTPEEVARLSAGDLRGRKAAAVGRHVSECTACGQLTGQLSGVSTLLASASYPEIPASLSSRIDTALAAEAAQRVAAELATEAGRRDLPARSGARRRGWLGAPQPRTSGRRAGWRMPAPALRVLATAAAIILVGTGGYEIASHTGGSPSGQSAAPAGSAHVPPAAHANQVATGPQVTYRQNGSAETIRTVTSDTNFHAATLADQAAAAVTEAKKDGVQASPAAGSNGVSAPVASASAGAGQLSTGAPNSANAANSQSQLAGCLSRLVPAGQVVLLVERARYEDAKATIIVAVPAWARDTNPPQDAQVWAVGEACSAANGDVLSHVRVARL